MKIEIELDTILYTLSAPAKARAKRGVAAGGPGIARKSLRARFGGVGAEAEALANEKLVAAGRMAEVTVAGGLGRMLQRRDTPAPDLGWRIKAELNKEYWWGPLRARAATMSPEELAIHARSLPVDGVREMPMPALQNIVSQWLLDARVPRVSGLGIPGRTGGSSSAPPAPFGQTIGSLSAFLASVPTGVTLGNPERLAATADGKGLTLAHEGSALTLSAGIDWERVFQAKAAYRGLEFSSSAKVIGGEQQEFKLGLQYGPEIADLKEAAEKFQGSGTALGDAIVNVPRLVGYLQERGIAPLVGVSDAVEQAKKIAGERDRTLPITFGLEAKVSREANTPPALSLTGNLSFRWDLLKKARPGAPTRTDEDPIPPLPYGDGRPLGTSLQARMEHFFGRALPDVQIHTGPGAAAAALQLGAEAFTIGRDIYFGADKYAPESQQGLGLLGHELTHVLQQEDRRTNGTRRAGGGETDTLEREAEATAKAITTSSSAVQTDALVIDEYRRTHRVSEGPPLTDAERVTLDLIAMQGREVCEQLLRSEHADLVATGQTLPRLRMTFDLDLTTTPPDAAAAAWGRKMAQTLVGALQTGVDSIFAGTSPGSPLLSPDGQAVTPQAATGGMTSGKAPASVAAPAGPIASAPAPGVPFRGRMFTIDPDQLRRLLEGLIGELGQSSAETVAYEFLRMGREDRLGLQLRGIDTELIDRVQAAFEPVLKQLQEEQKTFISQFENDAAEATRVVLTRSHEELKKEEEKYTHTLPGHPMPDADSVRAAAKALLDKRKEADVAAEAAMKANREMIDQNKHKAPFPFLAGTAPQMPYFPNPELREKAGKASDAWWKLEEEYGAMRADKEKAFPALAMYAYNEDGMAAARLEDLPTWGLLADWRLMDKISDEAHRRVKANEEAQKDMQDSARVWSLPRMLDLTLKQRKAKAFQERWVKDQAAKVRKAEKEQEEFIAAVAIGVSIVTTALTLGAALPAAGTAGAAVLATMAAGAQAVSTTITIAQAYKHLEQYRREAAASDSALDKANAISGGDPNFLWLALDLVAVVADVAAAKSAFGAMRKTIETARTTRNVSVLASELADVAQRSGVPKETLDSILKRASAEVEASATVAVRATAAANAALSPAQIVMTMEAHVATQNSRVATAIQNGNRAFFQNLGLSQRQINVLMNPASKTFAAQYGNAMERAVARAFRSDPRLSGMLLDARNMSGRIFPIPPSGRPLRPDFGFASGPLEGNIVDLTATGGREAKMAKYHDRVITLEYARPTF